MKRSVRQTGVLKRLLFLRRRAWELTIEGDRLACLWCSLLTASLNNLIVNDSRLSESVGIPALSIASQYDKLGKIIRMARLWIRSMSSDKCFGRIFWIKDMAFEFNFEILTVFLSPRWSSRHSKLGERVICYWHAQRIRWSCLQRTLQTGMLELLQETVNFKKVYDFVSPVVVAASI